MRPIGVIVSLGTGQVPLRAVDTVDVYRPEGIFDVTKIARGIQNLINVMVDKVMYFFELSKKLAIMDNNMEMTHMHF